MSVCLPVCLCLSVTLVGPAKTAEPIDMSFELRIRVGTRNHVLDGGPDPPMGRDNFEQGEGRLIVKYRDIVVSCAKRLNQSKRRLGYGLGWAEGIMYGVQIPHGKQF